MRRALLLASAGARESYRDTVMADSPIAYWRLNETSGTAMADENGTYGGTYYNTPTLGATSLLGGGGGTAVTFDRDSSEYAQVAHNSALNGSGNYLTVEMWVKVHDTAVTQVFLDKAAASGAGGQYSFYYGSAASGTLTCLIGSAGGGVTWTGCASSLSAGGHFVFVLDNTGAKTSRMYWNGTEVALASGIGLTWNAANTSPVDIARINGGGFYAAATLDEVALYNTALSADRVTAHYNARTT